MSRLCDRHTLSKDICPKCAEGLAQMILYASRHLALPGPRREGAAPVRERLPAVAELPEVKP